MAKIKRIYIASPYSNGWQSDNVRRQMDASNILMDLGFFPYTPLLTHFQSMIHPRKERDWLNLDLEWLSASHALVRIKPIINGKEILSNGADEEEAKARELGIHVFIFTTLEEMKYYFENNEI
jgi:hypothetical protein